jgi:glycosyltransferase involved in cell wall biosynthesis
MKLAIFTLVEHKIVDGKFYGYAPYVREMNLWTNYVDDVIVVGLKAKDNTVTDIDLAYSHPNIQFVEVPSFNIKSIQEIFKTLLSFPSIFFKMFKVMKKADHLHLRCPSNVSAIAAIVQIFFPRKPKTTKYAGNWNPRCFQRIGYWCQKALLRNTFLTKNMKVLVYGEWKNQTKNVYPFMSATYHNSERVAHIPRVYNKELNFIFIGSMVIGKRPMLTIQIIQGLRDKGYNCKLHMYGDGVLMDELKAYVDENELNDVVYLYGNQSKEVVREAIKKSHFTILPSKSEGWPKAIAEGMFFGAIPISTKISCLEWILDYGKRGVLIEAELDAAVIEISKCIEKNDLETMSKLAQEWSQVYTLDKLDKEIKIALGL